MQSIRRYLARSFALAQIAFLVALGIALYLAIRYNLNNELDQSLALQLETMSALVEYENGSIEFEELGPLAQRYSTQNEDPDYFELRTPDGETLMKSASLGDAELPFFPHIDLQLHLSNLTLPDGQPGRLATQRLRIRDSLPAQQAFLSVAIDRTEAVAFLKWFTVLYLVSSIVLVSVLIFSIHFALKKGLLPLLNLSGHAASLQVTNLGEPFPTDRIPEELAGISNALNTLMTRIQETLAREKQLTQDIAHDLRTPIAELRALVEATLNYPSGEAEVRHALQESHDISTKMTRLIETLLSLAKTDHSQVVPHLSPIDLVSNFLDASNSWQSEPGNRRIAFQNIGISSLSIQADPQLTGAIIQNLVDNAFEYAPDDSCIHLDCRQVGDTFEARVSNPAPNLTQSDLPNLFLRLWRKDAARHDSAHSGLGLALAQAYAEVQGFTLTAKLSEQGELAFTLSGPRSSAR